MCMLVCVSECYVIFQVLRWTEDSGYALGKTSVHLLVRDNFTPLLDPHRWEKWISKLNSGNRQERILLDDNWPINFRVDLQLLGKKNFKSARLLPSLCWKIFSRHVSAGGGGPCGVMIKAIDCGIVVSEFALQSCYYVHFRTNTLWKGMNPLIPLVMG